MDPLVFDILNALRTALGSPAHPLHPREALNAIGHRGILAARELQGTHQSLAEYVGEGGEDPHVIRAFRADIRALRAEMDGLLAEGNTLCQHPILRALSGESEPVPHPAMGPDFRFLMDQAEGVQ